MALDPSRPTVYPVLTYRDAGAELVMDVTDQPYGSREYAARDPDGNVWCFGTYQPAPVAPRPNG